MVCPRVGTTPPRTGERWCLPYAAGCIKMDLTRLQLRLAVVHGTKRISESRMGRHIATVTTAMLQVVSVVSDQQRVNQLALQLTP
jgi:hypothetical protein